MGLHFFVIFASFVEFSDFFVVIVEVISFAGLRGRR